MKGKTPLSEGEMNVAALSLYLRTKCVRVIGKEDTRLLILMMMNKSIAPPSDKGMLFIMRTISKLQGKIDDEVLQFIKDYFDIR